MKLDLLNKKCVGVLGLGKTGSSAMKTVLDSGAKLFAWDDSEKNRSSIEESLKGHITPTQNWDGVNYIIVSPGIPLTFPKPHPIVEFANKNNAKITSDVELFWEQNRAAKFVGITGTNGKSTTTSLISHILKHNNLSAQMGGNIGVPVFDLDKADIYVLETSSYQLDLIEKTRFNVAILLNITPDHLDRHGSMENYIVSKMRIFMNQTEEDVAIISVDNETTKIIFEEFPNAIAISTKTKLDTGVSVINNVIYYNGTEYNIGYLENLAGEHNAENLAAAVAACLSLGISVEKIIEAVKTFKSLTHRMQYLGQVSGVTFVNDSKGTNAESTEKALATYDDIYWILGGVAKAGGIEGLKPYFGKIRHAFLIGQATEEFAATLLAANIPFTKCKDLAESFEMAKSMATKQQGGTVLLSPACASFDQFKSFEERGELFIQLFNKYKETCK